MIDIISSHSGQDLGVLNTDIGRAGNILSIQIGSLEYAPELGIDLKYFLSEEFSFQNESFRSYLIQVLASNGINVASVTDTINNLFMKYTFNLQDSKNNSSLLVR